MDALGDSGRLSTPEIADALGELANVMELLPGHGVEAVRSLRHAARALGALPADTAPPADVVKHGLDDALETLVGRPPPEERAREYREAVIGFGREVDALKPDEPLLAQRVAVVKALRSAGDVELLASGEKSHFRSPVVEETQGPSHAPTDILLDRARAAALEMGTADWNGARDAAARLLGTIADLVASSSAAKETLERVSIIRLQAERLQRSDAIETTQWVKLGLTNALDALENAKGSERGVPPWARAARQAVADIKNDYALSFQRAAVQDGFRATVDAFVVGLSAQP
ncbi:MAG TPA: hypothetical protein VH062_15010 [Polyangiaceae bacterium]|nr:hypothetical protein [Polyangiaceae bacterium]